MSRRLVARGAALWLAAVAAPLAACGCGVSIREAPACTDGLDNDDDGLPDWPDDPGCRGPFDTDEMDPGQCGDGLDNDDDGFTDWPSDPACRTPESPLESDDPRGPAACANGRDDDRDGKTDYPIDPGCTTAHDDDETDPPSATVCADGRDNDADGLTDFPADPGCESSADGDETNAVISACGPGVTVADITRTSAAEGERRDRGRSSLQGSCGGLGAEAVYRFTLAGTKTVDLVATTEDPLTTLDTIVYIRSDCRVPATELACNDDARPGVKASTAVHHKAAPGTYYVVVDAFNPGSLGKYRLKVNAYVASGAVCDPSPSATERCAPGLLCRPATRGLPPTCEREICDDGHDNDGDGKTDFPFDPGCTSSTDDSEDDPSTTPQCADGSDNDADGKTDFPADPGCDAASDNVEIDECTPGLPIKTLTWAGASGVTAGASRAAGTCSFFSGASPEDVYLFINDKAYTSLSFTTDRPGTTFDTVVYVRVPKCGDPASERACNDDAPEREGDVGGSRATVLSPPVGQAYYVFVDGDDGQGLYQLRVSATVGQGERCDPTSDPSSGASPVRVSCETGWKCKGAAGAETCQRALCNDGLDNDGDGKTDYPFDPGCPDQGRDDEADPTPRPSCGNGADDDADGKTDFPGDPGCTSAADDFELDRCADYEVPLVGAGGVMGTLPANITAGTSSGSCVTAASGYPDQVFGFVVAQDLKTLTFSTDWPETTVDTVLYVRRDACRGGLEVGCNDDATGKGSTTTLLAPFKASYFVWVDSKPGMGGGFSGGAFRLTVSGEIARMGACDPASAVLSCEPGSTCKAAGGGAGFRCLSAACGNGADDDADGRTDFPADPGCDTSSDDTEGDPAILPVCSDGVDNDADGRTDFPADPGCQAASWGDEADGCGPGVSFLPLSSSGTVTGTTAGRNNFTPSCRPVSVAPEAVVPLSLPGPATQIRAFSAGMPFDTVLYARYQTCSFPGARCGGPATEDAARVCCNDNRAAGDPSSELLLLDRPAGNYFFFVDGARDAVSSSGAFSFAVTAELKPGATCDPARASYITCPAGLACRRKPPETIDTCQAP